MRGAGGEFERDSIKIHIIYGRSIVLYYACCLGTFGYFFLIFFFSGTVGYEHRHVVGAVAKTR